MANTVITHKKSSTPTAVPLALEFGELAINYADGKIFFKAANGSIYQIGGGSSGGDSFGSVNANGTVLVADTAGDILSVNPGEHIFITADVGSDTFTITANLAGPWNMANAANLLAFNTDTKAIAAHLTANTAYNKANAAHLTANTAYDKANAANILAFNTDTKAIAAFLNSNTAYGAANTTWTYAANTVMLAANSAFGRANIANLRPVGNTMSNGYYAIRSTRNALNIIPGSGITINVDDNATLNTANVTITATGGGGVTIVSDTANSTGLQYLTATPSTSGSASTLNVSVTKLTWNCSTGTLSATVFNSLSDREQKENIVVIDDGLDMIMQLNGVRFDWKDNHYPSMGIIAQDLLKVAPELVSADMSVNYQGIIAILIEAIKTQQKEIESIKTFLHINKQKDNE